MTWFAWQGYNNGKAVDIAGSQEKQAVSLGFHGYGTEAQAEKQPNSVAGFPNPLAIPQKAFVNAIIKDFGAAKKQQSQPGGANANILNPATALKAAATGDISSVLGFLGSSSVCIRIGESLLGLVLISVGTVKLAESNGAAKAIVRNVPALKYAKALVK